MSEKKRNHKKKKSKKDDDILLPDEPVIEDEISDESEESFDEDEFIDKVSELSKARKKVKLKSVFEVLGKPKKFLPVKSNGKLSKQMYNELLASLEVKGIMVHFKLDYSLEEKYRFITEEIFIEGVEDLGKKNHINFIYEDFHPELDEEEEDY